MYLPIGMKSYWRGSRAGLGTDWHRLPYSSAQSSPLPRTHPVNCWLAACLPACHAPRIAEGFAHVPWGQLHAGNWGLRQRRGVGVQWGRLNPALVGSCIVLRRVLLTAGRVEGLYCSVEGVRIFMEQFLGLLLDCWVFGP